jgi:hypothetical protein
MRRLLDRRSLLFGGLAMPLIGRSKAQAAPQSNNSAGHILLLGDSTLDNASYVRAATEVISQLRSFAPSGWTATLNAVDGAVMADVPRQLARIPDGVTHVVMSVGGNDALGAAGLLSERARSVGEVLGKIAAIRQRFWDAYRKTLDAVVARGFPTAICTIYDPRYSEAALRQISVVALAPLNDVISREAFTRKLPVLDLRLICGSDADFANPIEPSAEGGAKIARAILRFATAPAAAQSVVIAE